MGNVSWFSYFGQFLFPDKAWLFHWSGRLLRVQIFNFWKILDIYKDSFVVFAQIFSG